MPFNSEEDRVDDVASKCLADIARHVRGCQSAQETGAINAWDDEVGNSHIMQPQVLPGTGARLQ